MIDSAARPISVPEEAEKFKILSPISLVLISAIRSTSGAASKQHSLQSPSLESRKELLVEIITKSKDRLITELTELKEESLDTYLLDKLNEDLVPAFQELITKNPLNADLVKAQLELLIGESITHWGEKNLEPYKQVKSNLISREVTIAEKKVRAISSINFAYIKGQILYLLNDSKINRPFLQIQERLRYLVDQIGHELNPIQANVLTNWLEKQKPPELPAQILTNRIAAAGKP